MTEEDLRRMYQQEGMSYADIAATIGRSKTFIRNAAKRYGIPVRTEHNDRARQKLSKAHTGRVHTLEARKNMGKTWLGKTLPLSMRNNIARGNCGKTRTAEQCAKIRAGIVRSYENGVRSQPSAPKRPPRDYLEDVWCVQKLTQREIARLTNVNFNTVSRWLRHYGLPTRRTHFLPGKEELHRLFHDEGMTVTDIAARYKVNTNAVYSALHRHDIPLKKQKHITDLPRLSDDARKIAAWTLAWEGYISIANTKHGQLAPIVGIGNTNRELLNRFSDPVQYGHVLTTPEDRSHIRSKDMWQWTIRRMDEIKAFLEQIIDHLPAKRRQAELMLEFIAHRLSLYRQSNAGKVYSERDFAIYRSMRELNKKGLPE